MSRPIYYSLIFCLLWPIQGMADATPPKAGLAASVGASALFFDYAEYDDSGGLLDHEHHVIPGVTADISRTHQGWFEAGHVSYYSGVVRYDGQTQARVPVTTDTDERILDLFLQVGRQYRAADLFGYAFYAGVGHRSWERDIRSTETASGLSELYRWEYAAVGAQLVSREINRATWGVDLRWQRAVDPRLDVDFRGVFDSLQLALGQRDGVRFSVPWTKLLSERMQFVIEPFYDRWVLGRSANENLTSHGSVVGSVFEPNSVTNNRGVVVSLRNLF
jgi:hypothetical protein